MVESKTLINAAIQILIVGVISVVLNKRIKKVEEKVEKYEKYIEELNKKIESQNDLIKRLFSSVDKIYSDLYIKGNLGTPQSGDGSKIQDSKIGNTSHAKNHVSGMFPVSDSEIEKDLMSVLGNKSNILNSAWNVVPVSVATNPFELMQQVTKGMVSQLRQRKPNLNESTVEVVDEDEDDLEIIEENEIKEEMENLNRMSQNVETLDLSEPDSTNERDTFEDMPVLVDINVNENTESVFNDNKNILNVETGNIEEKENKIKKKRVKKT